MEKYIIQGPRPHRQIPKISAGQYIYNNLINSENHEAFINAKTKILITYKELLDGSVKLALCLEKNNFGKGCKIGLCSENNAEYFRIVISGLFVGAVIVPLNPYFEENELVPILKKCKPKVLFCSQKTLPKFLQLKRKLGNELRIILIDNTTPTLNSNELELLDEFEEKYSPGNFNSRKFQPTPVDITEHLAFILSTSGTTGLSKCAMLTHENLVTKFEHFNNPGLKIMSTCDYFFAALPFYCAYGITHYLGAITKNKILVFMSEFDKHIFLDAIQSYKFKHITLVPTLLNFLARNLTVDKYNISELTEIHCVSAPSNVDDELLVKERLNVIKIHRTYGLTETLGLTFMPGLKDKPGSIGKLVPNVLAKVCDPANGHTLGPMQNGELCFKGKSIFKGYFNDIENTKGVIDNEGWFHTGDIGYYDEDEYFYVVGRIKELIKYKGHQVSPTELQDLLLKNPKILEAAVVGLLDKVAGELPFAFVVKVPNQTLTEREVQSYVEKNISSHKWLRGGVKFIDKLPRNTLGKIQKSKLLELLKHPVSKL